MTFSIILLVLTSLLLSTVVFTAFCFLALTGRVDALEKQVRTLAVVVKNNL